MSKTEILRHSLRNITQILNNMENLCNSGKKQKPINYRLWRSTKFCKDATKAFKYCMGKCTNMRSTKRQDNRFLVHARKGSGWNKRGKKSVAWKRILSSLKWFNFQKKQYGSTIMFRFIKQHDVRTYTTQKDQWKAAAKQTPSILYNW